MAQSATVSRETPAVILNRKYIIIVALFGLNLAYFRPNPVYFGLNLVYFGLNLVYFGLNLVHCLTQVATIGLVLVFTGLSFDSQVRFNLSFLVVFIVILDCFSLIFANFRCFPAAFQLIFG